MELITRDRIDSIEQAMLASPLAVPAEVFPLVHHVTMAGLYAREGFLPAGAVVTGKAKKEPYITVLSAGAVVEITPFGRRMIQAPFTWVSEAAVKRIFITHTDCVITTIHRTAETDVSAIEVDILVEV